MRGPGSSRSSSGQRLGWKVYDEELVEAIAHRMGSPIEEVRALDELAPSMVQDWLLPLREEYYAPQEAYLDHLAKMIEAIGRAGESILVGRGAGFMLPRDTTLSIRVIAPLKVRAQRLAERMGVSPRTARRAARELDRRRAAVRPHDAPRQPERPAQLRPGAQHGQPRPGDCRRGRREHRSGPGGPMLSRAHAATGLHRRASNRPSRAGERWLGEGNPAALPGSAVPPLPVGPCWACDVGSQTMMTAPSINRRLSASAVPGSPRCSGRSGRRGR